MREPMRRADLDKLVAGGCGVPGCGHEHSANDAMYLHASCHLDGRLEVFYQAGVVTIRCLECERVVGQIAVRD